MSVSNHTQGLWQWDAGLVPPDGPGRYAVIYVLDDDREPIVIAEFNDSIPEGRANAHMMTAAPELYALALAFGDPDIGDAKFNEMRAAALAKAEGR